MTLDGLTVFVSPALEAVGVPHAFTTRLGGVSVGPFESLNLGFSTGDQPDDVLTNRARLCAALDCPPEALRFVKQVHGRTILQPAGDWPTGADGTPPEADGLLTDDPSYLIGVRTADCLPVLLATSDGRHVAAVHAGWRGLQQRIPAAAVDLLRSRAGCAADQLVAAVGPGIGAARYEVGPEVAAEFKSQFLRPLASGKPGLDLQGVAVAQLCEAGVTTVDRIPACTYDHPEWFFSYRRDGSRCGRQAAVIRTLPR